LLLVDTLGLLDFPDSVELEAGGAETVDDD